MNLKIELRFCEQALESINSAPKPNDEARIIIDNLSRR